MKIYNVQRVDDCDYDEYDNFVVLAETPEEALKTAKIESSHFWKEWKEESVIGTWDLDHTLNVRYVQKECLTDS